MYRNDYVTGLLVGGLVKILIEQNGHVRLTTVLAILALPDHGVKFVMDQLVKSHQVHTSGEWLCLPGHTPPPTGHGRVLRKR